jgi:hypothetical protein
MHDTAPRPSSLHRVIASANRGRSSRARADHVEMTNPIQSENQRAGTRDWLLERPYPRLHDGVRSTPVEGYCSRAYVRAGERIDFHLSTWEPTEATIDVYRSGYYGGEGGRHMTTLGPIATSRQLDPAVGPERLRACEWAVSASLEIPVDWVSGVYVGKLTERGNGYQSYVIFIVEDDRQADLLLQCSDFTWQAYNHWPDCFSLYTDGNTQWYTGPGVLVSFDRPYGKYAQLLDAPLSLGSGEWFLWEFPLAYWLEAEGYDVTYGSQLGIHERPQTLQRVAGLITVGHDEYWTQDAYDAVVAAVANGLNAGFLSGNAINFQIGLGPGVGGRPNRTMRRLDHFGARNEDLVEQYPEFDRYPFQAPHSRELMGAATPAPSLGGGDWTCRVPDHWVFEGTGMQEGDGVPGLVGWEHHGDPIDRPGLVVVAEGPIDGYHGEGSYSATVYEGPQGNVVFNAATIWWSDGLSEPPGYVRSQEYVPRKGPDPRVQQITRNVLARLGERRWIDQGGAS